jgi:hypothetical protein
MVLVDFLINKKTNINTPKLEIPDRLTPTKSIREGWYISPFGNNYNQNKELPYWVPLAAAIPAFLIFVVLFFEVELTGCEKNLLKEINYFICFANLNPLYLSLILNAKHRKLEKGTGFSLDLFLGGKSKEVDK